MFPAKKTGLFRIWLNKIAQPKRPMEDFSGLYLGEDRYLKIITQPADRPDFVSSISRTATNFQLAARYGNIGLVAHSYLGGRYFLSLKIGDIIYITGSRRSRWEYEIKQILQYQALDPRSPRSSFIDLRNNQMMTATEVFKNVYTGAHRLVLQTCIERGEIREWGRHFIIARPVHQFVPTR